MHPAQHGGQGCQIEEKLASALDDTVWQMSCTRGSHRLAVLAATQVYPCNGYAHWIQEGLSSVAVLTCVYEGHEDMLAECCHGDRIDDHRRGSQSKQEHCQSLGVLFEACTCERDTSVQASPSRVCMQR